MLFFFLFTQKFNFSHYLLMLMESKSRFYSPQNKSVVAEDSPEVFTAHQGSKLHLCKLNLGSQGFHSFGFYPSQAVLK